MPSDIDDEPLVLGVLDREVDEFLKAHAIVLQ
jgi:hypothetical protein